MNDKEIRAILVEYLKVNHPKIRMFQEKNIGNSVCDLMAVTDCLTGYEIKSDADDFRRLDSQIVAYNRFFDQCYIVVGESHIQTAEERIPHHWGILCIQTDAVTLHRKAKRNAGVKRRSQLSILWKLELKNLLIKNSLPLFAQREKGFIADRIAESVESVRLGKQIAEELFGRDYSLYQAEDYTIRQDKPVFQNIAETELVDNLSEERQVTLDEWIALYHKAQVIREKKEEVEKKKPVVRAKHDIKYTEITPTLGAPWISESIVNEFISHLCGKSEANYYFKPKAVREKITGNWNILQKKSTGAFMNTNLTSTYGISRYNALQILDATLNLRELKMYDGSRFNQKDTVAVLEKQRLITDEFARWVWESEDRIWEIEEAYNKMFVSFEKKEYDGSRLEFPQMNPAYSLYDYQKDAVQRIITTNNTLLAFDVGAGKTYIMIAAAMKMREMGLSKKNLFVVPNHIVGQWEKIFTELYPSAKVLAVEPKSFQPEKRMKVLRQIRDGDYDGIIIAYSSFEMIPLSVDYVRQEMETEIASLQEAMTELRHKSDYWGWGESALNKMKDHLRGVARELLKKVDASTPEITFDKLEVNTLFLDEAHNYKNIPLRTHLKNLNGINVKGSGKCLDMQKKVKCVQDQNGGRGVVFATGTPLCNSISDAYAMQMYLQPEAMAERGLHIFDNWVKTFALPEERCEIDVDTSKYRIIRRFVRFFNLPELSQMFSDVAVFHAVELKNLPTFSGYRDVIIRKHPLLTEYMSSLAERAETIRSGWIDRKKDNMLKVSTDGRKAALDLNLVGLEQEYDANSKIFRCAQTVYEIHRTHPDCSQVIFCDYSTPKEEGAFNVYAKMKELLVNMGMAAKEIAFVHSYHTESRKLALFADVNAGRIKVLLGSTFKLGIGANVQNKLRAVHHLDAPWRPADMVQREGRILRQGNENQEVDIYRYIAEGSFDAYSWQILETKQRFISQFLSGSTYQRSASDLEENVLTYAEVKALALAQPLMKVKAERENEIKNYRLLLAKEKEEKAALTDEQKRLKDVLVSKQNRCYHAQMTAREIPPNPIDKEELALLATQLTPQFIFGKERMPGWSISIFSISLPKVQDEKKPCILLCHNGEEYKIEMGEKPAGNAIRVKNFVKKFGEKIKELETEMDAIRERLWNIQAVLETGHDYAARIQELEEDLRTINERLNLSS